MTEAAEPQRWSPQLGPQTDAISATWCPELFFGGAAGGGKSDFLLGDYLQDVPTYGSAWRGILFRRTYPELEELMARAQELYPATGGRWNENKKTWRWPNGANLKLRYLARDLHVTRYQGHQYTWIGWDELTQWPSLYPYRYLRGRLRSARNVPTKRIRAAGNPGGPGHQAVKDYFVDPAPAGFLPITDPATGIERMFIPSRLNDNQILVKNDPTYRARLKALGGNLAKAMLDGDWNVVDGAFFDNWSSRNVVWPFEIPDDWTRFRSMDWGSAKPFSVGWWAVCGDATTVKDRNGDAMVIPRGCLVRYREWYGSTGEPNVGLKMTAEVFAKGVLERDAGERIAYGVADGSIFDADGGPSLGERMFKEGLAWRRADKTRVARVGAMGGWDQVRARLDGELTRDDAGNVLADEGPQLVVFTTCKDLIRTLPALQHDALKPEDVDSDMEDHAPDEARYACMSRPFVRAKPKPKPEGFGTLNTMTIDQMIARQQKRDEWL